MCRVHEKRKSYQIEEGSHLSEERVLCIGSSQKQPILKWENNMAWPGKLTLTDKAIYFEVLLHHWTLKYAQQGPSHVHKKYTVVKPFAMM